MQQLDPLIQTIRYIQLFRGRQTGRKARWLQDNIQYILSQSISNAEKAQGLLQVFSSWQSWMAVMPHRTGKVDALIQRCVSMGQELIQGLLDDS